MQEFENGSTQRELADRLSVIETMLAEGRQKTESWGWSFVLWGVAYYIAAAWATMGQSNIAWPVTMITASVLTAMIATRRRGNRPETTMGRAIASIWIAMGISLFLVCMSMALSGHAEQHTFLAFVEGMLGAANAASSLALKWKAQFACAVIWWASAAVSCFGTVTQGSIAFLVAIFLGQIVFGVWMMLAEARERKQRSAHA